MNGPEVRTTIKNSGKCYMIRLIIVGIFVDVDDTRRQGALLFLSHAGATSVAIAIVLPVENMSLLRLLFFS